MPDRKKCITLGIVFGFIIMFFTCCACSVMMICVDVPIKALEILSLLMIAYSCFISAYVSTQIYRRNGIYQGIICGGVIFCILFILSLFAHKAQFSLSVIIKFAVCIFFGAIGGIKGVNTRKTKIRIRE